MSLGQVRYDQIWSDMAGLSQKRLASELSHRFTNQVNYKSSEQQFERKHNKLI